jgi:hypothetical protein
MQPQNNVRSCVIKLDYSSKSPKGILHIHRVSLHRNNFGYYISLKNELTHATRSIGPYEGPISFSQALMLAATELKLEGL